VRHKTLVDVVLAYRKRYLEMIGKEESDARFLQCADIAIDWDMIEIKKKQVLHFFLVFFQTHAHARTRTHTHAHARTNVRTRTHIHTHTHVHTKHVPFYGWFRCFVVCIGFLRCARRREARSSPNVFSVNPYL